MKHDIYVLSDGKDIHGMAYAATQYLSTKEDMDARLVQLDDGSYMVQARTCNGAFKQLVGFDRVLNIKFCATDDGRASVEIGKGKWLDKVSGGVIGLFVYWPVAITTIYGVYKQGVLPHRVTQAVEGYLAA